MCTCGCAPTYICTQHVSCSCTNLGLFRQSLHYAPPCSINSLELATFIWHLLHDVLAPKDGLQVQPALLTMHPFVQNDLNTDRTDNRGIQLQCCATTCIGKASTRLSLVCALSSCAAATIPCHTQVLAMHDDTPELCPAWIPSCVQHLQMDSGKGLPSLTVAWIHDRQATAADHPDLAAQVFQCPAMAQPQSKRLTTLCESCQACVPMKAPWWQSQQLLG